MSETLMPFLAVHSATGLPKSTMYGLIAEKLFPAPIKIAGGRSSRWLKSEIDEWVSLQIEASRGVTPAVKSATP